MIATFSGKGFDRFFSIGIFIQVVVCVCGCVGVCVCPFCLFCVVCSVVVFEQELAEGGGGGSFLGGVSIHASISCWGYVARTHGYIYTRIYSRQQD